MPDHAGDRGAVRLDPGASRSPAYQPDPDIRELAGRPISRAQITRFGVTPGDRLADPKINRSYAELAAHDGFLPDPARVFRPTDKPRVERPMPYVRDSF
jgi:hypothetical protein